MKHEQIYRNQTGKDATGLDRNGIEFYYDSYLEWLKKQLRLNDSSLQLPCYNDLNIEMKKVSEKLHTDFKQTEKKYFEDGFNYCHHIIEKMLNK